MSELSIAITTNFPPLDIRQGHYQTFPYAETPRHKITFHSETVMVYLEPV